jgi:hypothetical protein
MCRLFVRRMQQTAFMSTYTGMPIKSDFFRSALLRLHQLEQMKALDAPDELITRQEQLVAEARAQLDEQEWARVLDEYPRFKAERQALNVLFDRFHERCESCAKKLPEGDARWCVPFEYADTPAPAPCPEWEGLSSRILNWRN